MTRGWTWPLNTPIADSENIMGFDASDCRCQSLPGLQDTFIVSNCPRHYDLYVPPLDDRPVSAPIITEGKYSPDRPVQMTVGATYYENSMPDNCPGFMHSRCYCENVGPGPTDDRGDVFLVIKGCPMHDPAGDTDYRNRHYPITRTVMK